MVGLGWTAPNRFKGDAGYLNSVHVLVRSVARYHAFLDLMTSSITFFVPTIVSSRIYQYEDLTDSSLGRLQDIDLSWHTHQLKATAYRWDTIQYIARTPDHDDKVEEGALSNGYDITARAWKVCALCSPISFRYLLAPRSFQARFGVPYSVCGCAPVSTGGVTEKLSKLFKSKPEPTGDSLVNTRPDLVSIEDSDADATHPSEHNSVVLVKHAASEAARANRQKKLAKRMKELEKDAQKGKLDDWERLRAERMRRDGHDTAFFMMMPYWGM